MRLTKNNINFVREVQVDGNPIQWYVVMKNNWVSDMRAYSYSNISRYSKPTPFPATDLPKTVQEFINDHACKLDWLDEETEFTITHYTYQ